MIGEYLLDNRSAQAMARFTALAAIFDPVTTGRLAAVGVGRGWRCWEVGAGGPSVAAWLADRVGPSGSVLATDIDVRWLPDDRGFEVLRHDVVADAPTEGFDLVHARLVLNHLPARDVALTNMARSLRPGGWLVVEDFDVDVQPCAVPDATTAEHYLANRIRAGFTALLAERGVDLEFGRKLPRLLRGHGLIEVGADAYLPVALPGAAMLEVANVVGVRADLVALRVATDAEIDRHLTSVATGALDIATPPLVSVWGRRPT